jgi:2-dehydro-3-deoxyphosphogluconate aldolase / (4S)-4-hydroxy-2-oxoglutarate aldolase
MTTSSIDQLAPQRLIPVLVLPDAGRARAVGEALVEGGVTCAEVTLRTPTALDAIEAMADVEGLSVGAGTVLTADDAHRALQRGARFVVSPGLSTDVHRVCDAERVPYLPGVLTPTEVMIAQALGLTTLKLFPASLIGGANGVKALSGPFGGLRFVPTGGIGIDDLPSYLSIPAVAAVGGSWFVTSRDLGAGDVSAIAERARRSVQAARQAEM